MVNLRLKLEKQVDKPRLDPQPAGPADPTGARIGVAAVVFQGGSRDTPLYLREKLRAGSRLQGPALVLQMDTTTVMPPGWTGEVDPFGNLVLEPE